MCNESKHARTEVWVWGGGEMLPFLKDGRQAEIRFWHVTPGLPEPMMLLICRNCGRCEFFLPHMRNIPREIPIDELPEEAKRDLGLN